MDELERKAREMFQSGEVWYEHGAADQDGYDGGKIRVFRDGSEQYIPDESIPTSESSL